ncbi:MAG TPA: MauE/DoxX family redox-associated membrane protein [Parapedobacter sp.]|uniref:MauE/DoxX family redox-associated membrane protein n=1 Tax=Parapedobacter sp. TaxID=1958893 RepID=UPI002D001DAA|nr:MauE/DoxX family redox-associated membrane protein [Parapedobacter sp.]HWK58473.1 MauE/DoxX family redox-associated membrane protein [Parapedobacter sp.]
MKLLTLIACFALFVYSGVDKLAHRSAFEIQVGKSPILTGHETFVSWAVPITELAIAVLLFIPWTRLIGYYGFFTLMVGFTVYIGMLMSGADHPPCGCNALLESLSLKNHVYVNLVFIGMSVYGVLND